MTTQPRTRRSVRSARGRLRPSILATNLEGIVAEWVNACSGGAVLTAWALHLHASAAFVALVGASPALGQLVQLPSQRLVAWMGARRTAIVASIAARQCYLVLVALPWLPAGAASARWIVMAIALASSLVGGLGNAAWQRWTTAVFRGRIRGRVLGPRGARAALSGAAASCAVGVLLDRAGATSRGALLSLLAAVAWAAGMLSAWLLARHAAPPRSADRIRRGALREALASAAVRRSLRYLCAWNAAVGLTAGITALYMVEQLQLGFGAMAAHGCAVALAYVLSVRAWNRVVRRYGAGAVLVLSSLGAAALPLLWATANAARLWPVALEAILGGAMLGGQATGALALPLSVAPPRRASDVVVAFSATSAVSLAAASVAGGMVATKLPALVLVAGQLVVGKKLLFAGGAAARLVAAGIGARVFRPRSA